MNQRFTIRFATPDDISVILGLVRELAIYEKLLDQCVATEEQFHQAFFGDPTPVAEALLGEVGGDVIAVAIFFHKFSTFTGKLGLYLEDLYVTPAFRGHGFGKALLIRLAKIAVERDYARLEWTVLDWNQPAIRIYDRIGADSMDDWTIRRLQGPSLYALANSGSTGETLNKKQAPGRKTL